MTKTSPITFGDVMSQVSNKDAAERKFDINANARISDGKFTGLDSGSFVKTEGQGNGWFSYDSNQNFNFGCSGLEAEGAEEAMKAVMDFYRGVKEAIDSKTA